MSPDKESGAIDRNEGFVRLDLLREAIETWGEEAQIVMAIEECSELTQALTGAYRGREDPSHVAEEIADVEIMLDQLKLIYGPDQVEEAKREKLHRLNGRLKGDDSDE